MKNLRSATQNNKMIVGSIYLTVASFDIKQTHKKYSPFFPTKTIYAFIFLQKNYVNKRLCAECEIKKSIPGGI